MDDPPVPALADIDSAAHTVVLREPSPDPAAFATFTYERPDPEHLILRGTLRDRPVVVTVDRLDPDTFPLRRNGFHWVRDAPSLGWRVTPR